MVNWMQRARKENLDLIKSWIDAGETNKPTLVKKAMLEIGCTEKKALEYINLLLSLS